MPWGSATSGLANVYSRPYLDGMAAREPIFNFSEAAPVRAAAVLIGLFALARYTPFGRMPEIGNLLVLRPLSRTDGEGFVSVLGHALAHSSWMHVMANSAMMVVFAILVMRGARSLAIRQGRSARPVLAFLAVMVVGVVGGALAQWAWWAAIGAVQASAVGASGGVSALFAVAGYAIGGRDQMLKFGLAWLVINALLVVFPVMGGIAWAAHLGGFAAGILIAPFVCAPSSTVFKVT